MLIKSLTWRDIIYFCDNKLAKEMMEQESKLSNYYNWMNAILNDYLEPHNTLMEILSNNNNIQDRVAFLRYLKNEYDLGVVEKLLEKGREDIITGDDKYFTSQELQEYSHLDRSYLLYCRALEKMEDLFNNAIPALLKKCTKMANEIGSNDNTDKEALCFDEKEEYLTTLEAAKFLGVEQSTIYHYTHTKKLVPISAGGKVNKFKKSDLLKMYKFKSYRNEELEKALEEEYNRIKKGKPQN